MGFAGCSTERGNSIAEAALRQRHYVHVTFNNQQAVDAAQGLARFV